MKTMKFFSTLGVVVCLLTVSVFLAAPQTGYAREIDGKVSATAQAPAPEDFAMMERMSRVLNYVAKNVSSAVVHITSTKNPKPSEQGTDDDEEDFFRRFFRDGRPGPNFRLPQPEPQMGMGSGVIIGADGYIVTNNHVVDGADKVKIKLSDGREFSPKWVRTDPMTDLALLKVEGTNLPTLELADSDKVQVGDWVLAVGNPFGLDNTVTQGIVSYIGRGIRISNTINYSNYIQTDAAINPGNSGGPLVNLRGQVIAINSAILSRTASYAGIGFAIPSNMVKFVTDQLRKSEQVVRSYLGVQIQDVTTLFAKNLGRSDTNGALVSDVSPNTPASRAGLKTGDIILELGGIPIRNSQQLQALVAERQPGQKVILKVWRDKKAIEISVMLEKMPKEFLSSRVMPQMPEEQESSSQTEVKDLGITITTLTKELAEKYKLKATAGAVITQVDPQGEGARQSLTEGDLILKVQDTPVRTAEDFVKALKKYNLKTGVMLYVKSSTGGSRFVSIILD